MNAHVTKPPPESKHTSSKVESGAKIEGCPPFDMEAFLSKMTSTFNANISKCVQQAMEPIKQKLESQVDQLKQEVRSSKHNEETMRIPLVIGMPHIRMNIHLAD